MGLKENYKIRRKNCKRQYVPRREANRGENMTAVQYYKKSKLYRESGHTDAMYDAIPAKRTAVGLQDGNGYTSAHV